MKKRSADSPPAIETLDRIPFALTIPDVSWYRHESWEPGQFKRFRHHHTMCQDVTGFEFFNEKDAQ